MLSRFVRPRYDQFFGRRGMLERAYQLHIMSETDDGSFWFGIKEGITNYCNDNGLDIGDVEWHIYTNPNSYDTTVITADSVDEWVRRFETLKPVFQIAENI
jgi:hypothetical protein